MSKRILILLVTLSLIVGFAVGLTPRGNVSFAEQETLTLAGGENDYAIVIAKKASSYELYAANTLQNYVKKITGKTLPIRRDSEVASDFEIVIGDTLRYETDTENIPNEKFYIKTQDKKLLLYGGGTRGTVYAVYSFLETYGKVSWYSSELTVVPESETLSIPSVIDYTYDCFFEYRDTDWLSSNDNEYSLANRLNSTENLGEYQGDYVPYLGSFCHTLTNFFCSKEEYFEKHPEYFAMVNGERIPSQLCLTNEKVYEIVSEEVLELLEKTHNPSADLQIVSLTQADNTEYCTCDKCKAVDEWMICKAGVKSATVFTFGIMPRTMQTPWVSSPISAYCREICRSSTKTESRESTSKGTII